MTHILTIDGPSGAGKGCVARIIAEQKKWALLDSGAIYRALSLSASNNKVLLNDEKSLVALALSLELSFEAIAGQELLSVYLQGVEVSKQLRTQACGEYASQIAKLGKVRQALLTSQRTFAQGIGLVADGRDMGTVVFPEAKTKIFLTASAKQRAKRRLKQLQNADNTSKIIDFLSGNTTNKQLELALNTIEKEIELRDYRDINRKNSPLKPAFNAVIIDTSVLTIDEVVMQVNALLALSQ